MKKICTLLLGRGLSIRSNLDFSNHNQRKNMGLRAQAGVYFVRLAVGDEAGVYFVRLAVGDEAVVKRVIR